MSRRAKPSPRRLADTLARNRRACCHGVTAEQERATMDAFDGNIPSDEAFERHGSKQVEDRVHRAYRFWVRLLALE
jgi:hypothetical protein